MAKSIPLSPKHGVNPTIPICFFCGQEKNEIALLGRIKKKDKNGCTVDSDMEAPMQAVIDYEPCDECREKFKEGVLLVGVTDKSPDGRPPIDGTHYPTGSFLLMKEEAFARIFPEVPETHAGQAVLMDESVILKLMEMAKQAEESEQN